MWEQGKVKRRKFKGVGRVRQSFHVLVREILLHVHALFVSRCVIMKRFDVSGASARLVSRVKTVDLSKHRFSVSISQ